MASIILSHLWLKSGWSMQQVISASLCFESVVILSADDPRCCGVPVYINHQWLTCSLVPSSYSTVSTPPCLWMLRCCTNVIIIRPHHSTASVDGAYCYGASSMICRSVTVVSPAKMAQPFCVEVWGGSKEPHIRWSPHPPWKVAIFRGGRGGPL